MDPQMDSQTITFFLNRYLYYPVVLVFVLNLIQRQYKQSGNRKRYATLYLGAFFLVFWGHTFLLLRLAMGDLWLLLFILPAIALAFIKRKAVFPYRRTCLRCGRGISFRSMLFEDDNLCAGCRDAGEDGEARSDGHD